MWKLVQKDLFLINKSLIPLALTIFLLISFFTLLTTMRYMARFFIVMGLIFLPLSAVVHKDINASNKGSPYTLTFLRSLPISCGTIVRAKYLFMVIIALITVLVFAAIITVFYSYGLLSAAELLKFSESIVLGLAGLMILGGLQLWLVFKYGSLNWLLGLVYGALVAGFFLLFFSAEGWLIGQNFSRTDSIIRIVLLLSSGVIIYLVTMVAAQKGLQSRDLS
jgi:hypothetical protein